MYSVFSAQMGKSVAVKENKMSILLSFEDGSIGTVGTVNYFAYGLSAYPKETLEIFSERPLQPIYRCNIGSVIPLNLYCHRISK